MWLAIKHPELLGTRASDSMVEQVTEDVSAFHQVFYATMMMEGPGPLNAALAEKPAPAQLRADIEDFAAALSATESARSDDSREPYDDMHAALELVLGEDTDVDEAIRYLLAITSLAARLTGTGANPNRALEGHVSAPGMLTHYLLVEPAMHAALVLHRHDDDNAVRTRMLSLAAQVAPAAAGDLAAEFPGLVGEDPRLEPPSRTRARHWRENAAQEVATAIARDWADRGQDDVAAIVAERARPVLGQASEFRLIPVASFRQSGRSCQGTGCVLGRSISDCPGDPGRSSRVNRGATR